jgi:hypothetical protein
MGAMRVLMAKETGTGDEKAAVTNFYNPNPMEKPR